MQPTLAVHHDGVAMQQRRALAVAPQDGVAADDLHGSLEGRRRAIGCHPLATVVRLPGQILHAGEASAGELDGGIVNAAVDEQARGVAQQVGALRQHDTELARLPGFAADAARLLGRARMDQRSHGTLLRPVRLPRAHRGRRALRG